MYCPKCGTQLPDDAGFCYKCGTKLTVGPQAQTSSVPSAPVVAPASATTMKCPSCGAPISPKFGEMLITCDYCGSSVSLANDGWKSIQKHTMLTLNLAQQDDVAKVLHGMMDRGLFHRHLQETSKLEEMNLALVPYWLIPVSARTSIVAADMAAEAGKVATTAALIGVMGAMGGGGRRGGGFGGGLGEGVILGSVLTGGMGGGQPARKAVTLDNNYNFPVVALKALSDYQPKEYQFDLEKRVLFDASKMKGVKVLNGDIGEDTAKYQAKTLVDQLQSTKAHEQYHMIQQMNTESDLGEGELLHAPVWFARYDHDGKKIVMVVDGNSGGFINVMGL